MQIDETNHLKRIWEENGWWFKRPLNTLQGEEIIFQVTRQVSRKKTLKKKKKEKKKKRGKTALSKAACAPRVCKNYTSSRGTPSHTRGACTSGWKIFIFLLRVWGKSLVFQPKPTWKSAYKYNSSYSQILI